MLEPANPSWNTVAQPLDCKGCHGRSTGGASFASSAGEPNYPNQGTNVAGSNSHQRHVGTSGAATTCINCHNNTVDAAGALKAGNTHTDKAIDVVSGNGKTFSWASGTKSCSSFASGCHYSGTPQWGATLGCVDCHASLSAVHAKHTLIAGATYGSVANTSTVAGYNFGCGNCHPTTTSFHADGIVEITLNKTHGGTLKSLNNVSNDTGGYTRTAGSSVVCSASYCHSNGGKAGGALSTTTFYASPDWFGTFSGDKCAMCHGNSPNAGGKVGSDAHYNKNLLGYANMSGGHVIGIHSDNIYNGTNGIAPEANSITGSHGRASTSSTINCNICHYSTVTTYANDKNAACQKCHYSGGIGGVKNPADLIANKSFHVNGAVDVAFYPSLSVASKAQLRDYSYDTATWARKNGYKFTSTSSHDNAVTALNTATMWNSATKGCTNIACHNGKSVTWTATNGVTTCYSCHTSLWNAK